METGLRPTWPGAGQQMPGHTHAGPQLSPVRGREDTSSTQGPTTPSPRAGRPIPPSPEGFPHCPGHPVALPTQVPSSGLPLATCGSALGQGLSPSPCPEGHPRVALTGSQGPRGTLRHQGHHPASLGGYDQEQVTSPALGLVSSSPMGQRAPPLPSQQTLDAWHWSSPPNTASTSPTSGPEAGASAPPPRPPGPPRGTRRRHGRSDTGLTLLCLSERRSAARPLPASAWHGAQTYF